MMTDHETAMSEHGGVPLVAHVIYSLGTGGLENGLVNIINRCPVDRYRHVIVCLTTAQEFADRITTPGVEVIELNKRDGKDWPVYWRLLKVLWRLKPAILHTRNLAALDVQVLGLMVPSLKQVHGEHGRDIYDLDGLNRKYALLRKFMRLFVDRYIAVSEDLQLWLLQTIQVAPERVEQIYNGVDHKKFQPRGERRPAVLPTRFLPDGPGVVIGTVGRLAPVKDQQQILQAVSLIVSRDPLWRESLRVVLVGDGPLMQELAALSERLGLTELVWMPGDRDDIPALLQAMDIFILPSLAEGISNTILEAMSAGLPVIATDTGGNPELISHGETGFLVPVGSAALLADALQQLLVSPELRAGIGNSALKQVRERFDWSITVENYLKIYDELLGIAGRETNGAPVAEQKNNLEIG